MRYRYRYGFPEVKKGECLNTRKASLPSDSRRIAETYYHLGVALGLHNKFDEAIKNLDDAIAVITKRYINLA